VTHRRPLNEWAASFDLFGCNGIADLSAGTGCLAQVAGKHTGEFPFAEGACDPALESNAPKLLGQHPSIAGGEPNAQLPATTERKPIFYRVLGSYFELGFCAWRTISVDGSLKRLEIDPPPAPPQE
jgi:hypothetical protein